MFCCYSQHDKQINQFEYLLGLPMYDILSMIWSRIWTCHNMDMFLQPKIIHVVKSYRTRINQSSGIGGSLVPDQWSPVDLLIKTRNEISSNLNLDLAYNLSYFSNESTNLTRSKSMYAKSKSNSMLVSDR